jgi:hypothetical protein
VSFEQVPQRCVDRRAKQGWQDAKASQEHSATERAAGHRFLDLSAAI